MGKNIESSYLNYELDWREFGKRFCFEVCSVRQIHSGNMKYTYVINTSNGIYVAQKCKYGDYLSSKIPLIANLTTELNRHSNGLMYPEFICTDDGVWSVNGFSLQRFIPNDCFPKGKFSNSIVTTAQKCAKALRKFHEACNFAGRLPYQDLPRRLNLQVIEKRFKKAELYGAGIIHGEFRIRNLLFDECSPKAVIDMDSICYGARHIDIAYLMLDFVELDVENLDELVEEICRAYDACIPREAGFAALGLLISDYIEKCERGYLTNNRTLKIADYKELLHRIIARCY